MNDLEIKEVSSLKYVGSPPLWKHQKNAVNFVSRYFRNPENIKFAAMIRMPTATGKTGIMAILSNFFPRIKNILIVAPAAFLTYQICDALNNDFWEKINIQPKGGPKPSVVFVPSTLKQKLTNDPSLKDDNKQIYICTPQTLSMLHINAFPKRFSNKEQKTEWLKPYEKLREITDAVIVDEGHREPAKEWAKAVRSFKKPTILFSATPYRNDLRFFKVGFDKKKYHFVYKYHDAVKDRIIRDIRFKSSTYDYTGQPGEFVQQLREFYDTDFNNVVPKGVQNPKVIIRCEDLFSIKKIKNAFESQELEDVKAGKRNGPRRVIAVHDKFSKDDPEKGEFKTVPKSNSATYWIHQFKLTEGLDNEDFCIIAFYQAFSNARSLVQQIGRILRNTNNYKNQKAIVFFNQKDKLDKHWKGYLGFESSKYSIVGPEEIVEALSKALPEWFYASRLYRQPTNFHDLVSIKNDFKIRKSAEIFRLSEDFEESDLLDISDEISELMEDQDMVEISRIYPEMLGKGRILLFHWRVKQSDILDEGGFFDISLASTFFYQNDDLLFYQGAISLGTTELSKLIKPITPGELEKLLSGNSAIIKQVSLTNCDLGNTCVRRRSMGALSIEASAPGLNDHFHFCSTAVGSFLDQDVLKRRYIGFTRARITEIEQKQVKLDEFCNWADIISISIKDESRKTHSVFRRYAQHIPSPDSAEPAHMLLELEEFFAGFKPIEGELPEVFPDQFLAAACEIKDRIDENGKSYNFECQIGNETIRGIVKYIGKKFRIVSDDLDKSFKVKEGHSSRNKYGSTFFSNKPVLRIVTKDGDLYADGRFYRPRIPLWGNNRVESLGILTGLEELANIDPNLGEKGNLQKSGSSWDKGCLFYFIEKNVNIYSSAEFSPTYLICEDLGTETADYVAIDEDHKKIAIIHAKMGDGPNSFSLRAIQIVHAQVIKNLEWLNPFASFAPDKGEKWNGYWNEEQRIWKKKVRRIRPVHGRTVRRKDAGKWLFNKFQDMLKQTDVEKEVWIVLGRGFSVQNFINKLSDSDNHPPYEIIQLAYLLQSVNSNVSSVGAKLKVFSSKI